MMDGVKGSSEKGYKESLRLEEKGVSVCGGEVREAWGTLVYLVR